MERRIRDIKESFSFGSYEEQLVSEGNYSVISLNNSSLHRNRSTQRDELISNKKKMSYEDTMKLIDYIFISNYWDKKRGNAILVNDEQISKWIKHFNGVKFDFIASYSGAKEAKSPLYVKKIKSIIETKYKIINDILLMGNGKISLCGGSLIQLMFDGKNDDYKSDFDLFFHDISIKEADELLLNCLRMMEDNVENHIVNQRVHTVYYSNLTIQFIKRIYDTKDQVLLGFDLAPSRIGYNPFDGLYATVCGGLSIAMKCFPLDTTQRSLSFGHRLEKYMRKGFDILYPGIPSNFSGNIITPDVDLKIRNNEVAFIFNRGKNKIESDYDGYDCNHMIWFYIANEKNHLVNFLGSLEEVLKLDDKFIAKSVKSHSLFTKNGYTYEYDTIDRINIKTDKFFLGDRYREFVNAVIVDEDSIRGNQIWGERCDWYIQKGLEIAKLTKENRWKIENPGSQSFGKFNPILEHPKMWYGENYRSVEIGIKTPRLQALIECIKNDSYMNIPEEIFKLICCFWLEAEVNLARDYLFSLF